MLPHCPFILRLYLGASKLNDEIDFVLADKKAPLYYKLIAVQTLFSCLNLPSFRN